MSFKFWFITIILSLSITSTFSQGYNCSYLIPYRENKLWGFSDTLGNIKIKPAYDEAGFFRNLGGSFYYYATVFKDNKKALVDASGKLATPFFDSLVLIRDDYYYVRDNNKYGVYHLRDKLVVPMVYDTFMSIKNYPKYKREYYKLIARKDSTYYLITYINNKTEEIEKPKPEPKNVALIERDSNSPSYVEVAAPQEGITYVSAAKLYPQGQMSVLKQNKKAGVVNGKNEVLVPCEYDSILIINNSIFITVKKKKYGVVFLSSVYKPIPNKYDKLEYAGGLTVTNNWYFALFKIVKNNKTGYVGENGIEYFTR